MEASREESLQQIYSAKELYIVKEGKDPSLYTVVLEDTAAELGLVIAFLGLFLGHLFNNPYLDGIAAICIGVLLAGVAIILLYETKGLLVGEGQNIDELEDVKELVEADEAIVRCGRILSIYMGLDSLKMVMAQHDAFRVMDEGSSKKEFDEAEKSFLSGS